MNKIITALAVLLAIGIAIVFPALALADQTISSTRDSTYDWRCETSGGTVISNHQREGKAQQACWNQALKNPGETYIVRGGVYRLIASGDSTPPPVTPPGENSTTLHWIAPNKDVNGDPLRPGDLQGFNIYLETPSASLLGMVAGDVTSFEYITTESGEHCFSATAIAEAESARSNVVCHSL